MLHRPIVKDDDYESTCESTDLLSEFGGIDLLSSADITNYQDDTRSVSCEVINDYLTKAFDQMKFTTNESIDDLTISRAQFLQRCSVGSIKRFPYQCTFESSDGIPCDKSTRNPIKLCKIHAITQYAGCKIQCIYDSNEVLTSIYKTGRCLEKTVSGYGLCSIHAGVPFYRQKQLYDIHWAKYVMHKQSDDIVKHYCILKLEQ